MENVKQYATAQDVIMSEILQDDEQKSNETLDLLNFMQFNATPLTQEQFQAILLLQTNGLDDLADLVLSMKFLATPQKTYMSTIEKLTLADRIKGNAKLSHLVKSDGLANPAGQLRASDVQAQGMSRREIDRY